MRRGVVLGALVGVIVSALPIASAQAATRSASECLRMFDADVGTYNRDKWPDDVVAVATGRNGTTYTLRCGNELSGVIHIAHDDSTGSTHPIDVHGADDVTLAGCFRRTVESGTLNVMADGRHRYIRTYGESGGKSYVYAGAQGAVYTVYTNLGGQGNDWSGCAQ